MVVSEKPREALNGELLFGNVENFTLLNLAILYY